MVFSHSCFMYATWKSKEVGRGKGEVLKQLFEKGDQFSWDRVDTSGYHAYNFQPGNCSIVN